MALETKYTNGFDYTRVWNTLKGRLGWRQPTVTSPTLDNDNKASASGRYFDGFHALCNIVNIKNTQADSAISDNNFNTLLQLMYQDVALRCLNGVFNVPELVEEKLLFSRYGQSTETVTNTGLFVGYVIEIAQDQSISSQINSVSLYFTEAKTFNLYLFKEGVKTPILTKEVTTVAYSETVVDLDGCILQYISSLGHGHRFYLGYFQDDLGTSKAISVHADWHKTRCFNAVVFASLKTAGELDFNHEHYTLQTRPLGINMVMSSFRDHTQAIIKKPYLFDELIGLQMAANVIEGIMHSTRSNGTERQLKEGIDKLMVYMDLKGTIPISDAPNTTGLAQQIQQELERLKNTFYPKPKAVSQSLC
jgi:hypothetical protein